MSTASTFALTTHGFVDSEISLDFHLFVSTIKAALVYYILPLMSQFVSPFATWTFLRYVNVLLDISLQYNYAVVLAVDSRNLCF